MSGAPFLAGEAQELRQLVLDSLSAQAFQVRNEREVHFRQRRDKRSIRRRHQHTVEKKIALARSALGSREPQLIERLLDGSALNPAAVSPRLVQVRPDSLEARLFRYASLHWSIPVSEGYGRRLRFLVLDAGHGDRLMGLFGLGDPVYSIAARDAWVGWTPAQKAARLYHVMDA